MGSASYSRRTDTRQYGLYSKSADGTGKEELFSAPEEGARYPCSWADNGKILILDDFIRKHRLFPTEGDRKWKPLLEEKHYEAQPRISPDGRWMVYLSDESGRSEIYVRPFPEVNAGKWLISASGGYSPLWSRDGRELFYRSGDATISVSVKTNQTFSFSTPRVLFRGSYVSLAPDLTPWDIRPGMGSAS